MTEYNVLNAVTTLVETLKEKGALVYLGVLPDIGPGGRTGADNFIVAQGVGSFKKWLGTVKPFEHPELFKLELLLTAIPFNTPKEEIPFKIKSLLNELVKFDQGTAELFINSRVKDYFGLTGKEVDSLIKQLSATRKASKGTLDECSTHYAMDDEGFFCRIEYQEGFPVYRRLMNAEVKIEKELVEDNGVNRSSLYLLSGKQKGETLPTIEVPVSSFSNMNWIYKWGSRVIIEPGSNIKDIIRYGILVNSSPVKEMIYTHTGWLTVDDNYVYLTSGGAIGSDNINVKLPEELKRYNLPSRPRNEIEAIRRSLSFIDIGKESITIPLLSAIYLAPLTSLLSPMPNFIMYLHGPTGSFKTTLATLALCHFGEFEPNEHSSFNDTENALERRGFTLKDVPMILDDYHPSSNRSESREKERTAQRIIRSFSNRTGRARLNPNATEKGRCSPRGMLIITGEELVSVQSTLARLSLIEINSGDINEERLTGLQAQSDLLPHAMSSFIHWVRKNMNTIKKQFYPNFLELRKLANEMKRLDHFKLDEQFAFLQFSISLLTAWAIEKGALSKEESRKLSDKAAEIFISNAQNLNNKLRDEDPIFIFNEIICSMLEVSEVRLENVKGTTTQSDSCNAVLVGYYDKNYLYFLPTSLWSAIQRFCKREGINFPCSKNALFRQLRVRNLIETRSSENTVTCRIHGKSIRVLKIYRKKGSIISE